MVEMDQAWLIPALPAAAFVVLALFHNYLPRRGDLIAIGAVAASFLLFVFVLVDLLDQLPGELFGNLSGFDWVEIAAIDFKLRIGFLVDQLSVVMLGVVSLVSLLVHVYSVGYMKGEARYGWYFAVLALFTASMLALVLADNFLLLYITWEGVGICSYLLIGYYFDRRSAVEAAKKAFITTRLGDIGLLIGIILLWHETGTFDMSETFRFAHALNDGVLDDKAYLTLATVLVFFGAMGKSAQFPFHVWLPDAMEGPTPVSALIHAATMVVAGVYLVARTFPLFEVATWSLDFVVAIGLVTTLMSAAMGLVMTDIKRVIAYSTLNSLGLMMVALGAGSPAAAMLYLFAHAFFKALLFLGAGSVIHATEKQDVEELGGLLRKMPLTGWTFAIGAMAMAGLVPLSGFFAKDEILVAAQDYHWSVFVILLASLPLTAMYMMRVFMLTFLGQPREEHAYEHAHESPPLISWPLLLLAAFAAIAGFVVFEGIGDAIGLEAGFLGFIERVFEEDVHAFEFDWAVAVGSSALVVAGLGAAVYAYRGDAAPARAARRRAPLVYQVVRNKFYMDDAYQWAIDHVVLVASRFIAFFDRAVVNDTGVNGAADVTHGSGFLLKLQQTGRLPNYALAMILGVVVLAVIGYSVRG
jgi:NADH-quinone oxidoreductase subunit L